MQNSLRLPLERAEVDYSAGFFPEHHALYECLRDELNWQQPSVQVYGKSHVVPRLTAFMGDAGVSYRYSGLLHTAEPWHASLQGLRQAVSEHCGAEFNSVLINYYRDGQDCMGLHRDNEAELGLRPLIASLSLGASCRFTFCPVKGFQAKALRFDLHGGDLLLMSGDTQDHWLHGVARQKARSAGRINLSFRQLHSVY